MPCCTYLGDEEVNAWKYRLMDNELNDLLVEVNAIPGERWCIQPINTLKRRWLRKSQPITLYCLYAFIAGLEWQVINFPGGASSINTIVDKAYIQTYLFGYLGGRGKLLTPINPPCPPQDCPNPDESQGI